MVMMMTAMRMIIMMIIVRTSGEKKIIVIKYKQRRFYSQLDYDGQRARVCTGEFILNVI